MASAPRERTLLLHPVAFFKAFEQAFGQALPHGGEVHRHFLRLCDLVPGSQIDLHGPILV